MDNTGRDDTTDRIIGTLIAMIGFIIIAGNLAKASAAVAAAGNTIYTMYVELAAAGGLVDPASAVGVMFAVAVINSGALVEEGGNLAKGVYGVIAGAFIAAAGTALSCLGEDGVDIAREYMKSGLENLEKSG